MIAIFRIYLQRDMYGNLHGETREFFRFYDTDEVPEDLEERVRRWSKRFDCGFEIQRENGTTTIYPD